MTKNVDDTIRFANQYLSYLVTEFNFEPVALYYVSYEAHFGYRKGPIEIHFSCDADGRSLPSMAVRFDPDPSSAGDGSKRASYYPGAVECSIALRKMFLERSERLRPKERRLVECSNRTKSVSNDCFRELDEDYEEAGRGEVEALVRYDADFLPRHAEILQGDFSSFPAVETSRAATQTKILLPQRDGSMNVVDVGDVTGSSSGTRTSTFIVMVTVLLLLVLLFLVKLLFSMRLMAS
ncbi:MAG: hypothetical protein JWP27_2214 [Flaviaesturariibacter sp.]|nr:hypothetical protein [Flaviaesturariibacter sp.]